MASPAPADSAHPRPSSRPDLRIVSLLPSASEIVAALGLTDRLVGRSHECDYPPAVTHLPVCTAPQFNPVGTSREVHQRVTDLLQTALSVYEVKTAQLARLRPTHIVTQAQCEVCAVSLADVEAAAAALTQPSPQILSLQPQTLAEVWADIQRVGEALGQDSSSLVAQLQSRVHHCRDGVRAIAPEHRPTVVCLEWTDPPMAAGNWIPEMVELAGGRSLFGQTGQPSPWLDWEMVLTADPDVLVVLPCGYDLDKTRQEMEPLTQRPGWSSLKAVRSGRVYLADGNQYLNRPGPRLVDSLEILAEMLHPNLFQFGYSPQGWQVF